MDAALEEIAGQSEGFSGREISKLGIACQVIVCPNKNVATADHLF